MHGKLSQLFNDAVHDGLILRSPTSRRTSPGTGKQRPYVATTEQVWALYDAMPPAARPAILLAAFAGLRLSEAVALRFSDVDFLGARICPAVQYPAEELKTEISKTPIPVPRELMDELNYNAVKFGSKTVVAQESGLPMAASTFDRLFSEVRETVPSLPKGFRFHDLRHYFASLLIHQGLDIKTVQMCMRHASAKTTLDTYGHIWPDKDESARDAVRSILDARADSLRTGTHPSQQ
jgi:integrase